MGLCVCGGQHTECVLKVERDLQRQLKEAQEERNKLKTKLTKTQTLRVNDILELQRQRDAAIKERDLERVAEERMSAAYTRLSFYTGALNRQSDAQTARAETAEKTVEGGTGARRGG